MRILKKYFALLLLCTVTGTGIYLPSCKVRKNTSAACAPTYTADIKKILDVNCAGPCHNPEKKRHGMLDLSTYEAVKGPSADSTFIGAIMHKDGFTPMPKNRSKLDDATIEKISCWIRNGSPE